MIGARDTTVAAAEAQAGVMRRLLPAERVALACRMSEEVRAITVDGVRHRHPEYGLRDVDEAVRRLFLGAELANRIGRPLLSDT